jgi:hypothetical protein
MKSILIVAFYQLLRTIVSRYVDQDLFDRVRDLVLQLTDATLSGEDKRAAVHDAVKAELDDVSSIIVNAIIETVLLKFYDVDEA